jgi:hypothetical protein
VGVGVGGDTRARWGGGCRKRLGLDHPQAIARAPGTAAKCSKCAFWGTRGQGGRLKPGHCITPHTNTQTRTMYTPTAPPTRVKLAHHAGSGPLPHGGPVAALLQLRRQRERQGELMGGCVGPGLADG